MCLVPLATLGFSGFDLLSSHLFLQLVLRPACTPFQLHIPRALRVEANEIEPHVCLHEVVLDALTVQVRQAQIELAIEALETRWRRARRVARLGH